EKTTRALIVAALVAVKCLLSFLVVGPLCLEFLKRQAAFEQYLAFRDELVAAIVEEGILLRQFGRALLERRGPECFARDVTGRFLNHVWRGRIDTNEFQFRSRRG